MNLARPPRTCRLRHGQDDALPWPLVRRGPPVAKVRVMPAEAIPFLTVGLRAAVEPVLESLLEWVEV